MCFILPGPATFNYFTQLTGLPYLEIELGGYILQYEIDTNKISDIMQEGQNFGGLEALPLGNGSMLYPVSNGFWLKDLQQDYWFLPAPGTKFYNSGDFNTLYSFDAQSCQVTSVSFTFSSFQSRNLTNCPCQSGEVSPVTAYVDSDLINIAYFCGTSEFYIAREGYALGPYVLPLQEN